MRTRRSGLAISGTLAGLLLCLSACASTSGAKPDDDDIDVTGAVTQPLHDLNLQRTDIPDVLEKALAAAYWPPPSDCAALARDIAALDEALGPDLDVEPVRDVNEMNDFLEGTLRDAATGWIPFRSVLRRMTGAEAHDREVEAAGIAGAVRRGYLKGYGERMGCAPPAAPVRTPAPAKAPTK